MLDCVLVPRTVLRWLVDLSEELCDLRLEETKNNEEEKRAHWTASVSLVDDIGDAMKRKKEDAANMSTARHAWYNSEARGPGLNWAVADLKKVVDELDAETQAAVLPAMRALEELCRQT